MMNRYTHHRGKGLFISRRSPSQTWPVVLSAEAITRVLPLAHKKKAHARMLTKVMPAT
jgi:hypothetical protein